MKGRKSNNKNVIYNSPSEIRNFSLSLLSLHNAEEVRVLRTKYSALNENDFSIRNFSRRK